MLYVPKLDAALRASRDRFGKFEHQFGRELEILRSSLEELGSMTAAAVVERLGGIPSPGALPSSEHDRYPGLVVPFGIKWSNHQEARNWALKAIEGVTTLAVDGSQIVPSKDYSLPVAAVQIGWFENPHRAGASYVKDVQLELMAPDDLVDRSTGGFMFSQMAVDLRRHQMETGKIVEHVLRWKGVDPHPVAFFDGTLVVSFASAMSPAERSSYVRAILELLSASREARVPVVGYVDRSYAKDLVTMIGNLTGSKPAPTLGISDAHLVGGRMQWGDRTKAFVCARGDILGDYRSDEWGDHTRELCFVYLKTTSDSPPARIDFPRWLLEEGLIDQVLDVVRAEAIIGNGYPYAIEAADAVAVLGVDDRERFYRIFQEFVEREGLSMTVARKAVSKKRRRV